MTQPRALITGIAGFAGSHLADELLACGYAVSGTVLPGEPLDNIAHIQGLVDLLQLDITDPHQVREVIGKARPSHLFHLAAFASVGQSFDHEQLVYRVNFDGTLNLLGAARSLDSLERFVFVSSSDCYGKVSPSEKVLSESDRYAPTSPYAIAKAAAEYACYDWQRRFDLPVVVARSFNHSGPRQSDTFVIPSFARQIAELERSRRKAEIRVGNLDIRRDISDVRDIVCGYRLLAEKGQPGRAYQLCSGRATRIATVLKLLLQQASRHIKIAVDPNRVRPHDIPVIRGSNRLAVKELGYSTRYSLSTTLRDTLVFWREKIAGS